MFPRFSTHYRSNRIVRNIKDLTESSMGMPINMKFSKIYHLLRRQFCFRGSFPARLAISALFYHIALVISVRSCKQMLWLYAARIVTAMTDKKSLWYIAVQFGINPPMGTNIFTTIPEHPITVLISAGYPDNTITRFSGFREKIFHTIHASLISHIEVIC